MWTVLQFSSSQSIEFSHSKTLEINIETVWRAVNRYKETENM